MTLEVYTWWQEPSELQAFKSVTNYYEATHDKVTVANITQDLAKHTRLDLAERMLERSAPASYQANIGADLLRWTAVEDADAGVPSVSLISPLSDLLDVNTLRDNLKDPLMMGSQGPYAVPVNVHRLNVVYYKKSLQPPPTFQDLCPDDVETLMQSPGNQPRMSIVFAASQDPWPITLAALESLLPAYAGATYYRMLFQGTPPDGWTTQFRHVLTCLAYMGRSRFGNPTDYSWADAAASVAGDSGADMTVMGDWVRGKLRQQIHDGTVVEWPLQGPGEKIFTFTSDTFPLPMGTRYPTETRELLQTLASKQGQILFSSIKGSIPALRGTVASDLPDLPNVGLTISDFEDSSVQKVLATSGLFPPYYDSALVSSALQQIVTNPNDSSWIDAALNAFASQLQLLVDWHNRMLAGPATP